MLIKLSRSTNVVAVQPNVFSHEECAQLLNFEMDNSDELLYMEQYYWFIKKLGDIVTFANNYYQFDINEIQDFQFKVITNKQPASINWKSDQSGDVQFSTRKLSIHIFLSSSSEYKGGKLTFFGKEETYEQEQGTVLIFPSFKQYFYNPVTDGTLKILNAWATGPHFR